MRQTDLIGYRNRLGLAMNGIKAGIVWGVMLALLALAIPAFTRADARHEFKAGLWSGSAISDRQCQINQRYPNGEWLAILLSRQGGLSVVIAKDGFDFYERDLVAFVRTDALELGNFRIEVLDVDSFRVVLGAEEGHVEALRRGFALYVETDPQTFRFDLTGSNKALLRLAKCAAALDDKPKPRFGEQATRVGPPPTGSGYVAFAAGQRSCAEFVAARQQPDDGETINYRYAVEQWVAGYLTATNKNLNDSENILGNMNLGHALTLLETLCLEDENAKLAQAAELLVFLLYPNRARDSDK